MASKSVDAAQRTSAFGNDSTPKDQFLHKNCSVLVEFESL